MGSGEFISALKVLLAKALLHDVGRYELTGEEWDTLESLELWYHEWKEERERG